MLISCGFRQCIRHRVASSVCGCKDLAIAELHIRDLRLLRVSWHPRDVHRFLFLINRAENELPKPCYRLVASWNVVLATMKCLDARLVVDAIAAAGRGVHDRHV